MLVFSPFGFFVGMTVFAAAAFGLGFGVGVVVERRGDVRHAPH